MPKMEKNATVFAQLILWLDDRIMCRVKQDAKRNEKNSLDILRYHYLSKENENIISTETMTDYEIQAEENLRFR